MQPGLFLVRTKDAIKGAFVLSMVVQVTHAVASILVHTRQGLPIHHMLEQLDNGIYIVNGQRFGNCVTLADLIKTMRSPSLAAGTVIAPSLHWQRRVDAAAGQAHHAQHGARFTGLAVRAAVAGQPGRPVHAPARRR